MRARQFSCPTSGVATQAACGQHVANTRRYLGERDIGRTVGARRRDKMGLGPTREGVGDAARESILRFRVQAVLRIEISITETDTLSGGESKPQESENSKQSTRGKDGRLKSALRRQKNCSAPKARPNARAGTSLSITLLLPCPLLSVLGGNLSKLDAGTSLSVSGASRCHF